MQIDLIAVLALLTAHFVGDFLLQNDWMALNKSKSWWVLTAHCFVYSVLVGATLATYTNNSPMAVLLVFAPHFLTDAITSRITAKLWQANQRHWFFVTIGFDQLLHAIQLLLTLYFLGN